MLEECRLILGDQSLEFYPHGTFLIFRNNK